MKLDSKKAKSMLMILGFMAFFANGDNYAVAPLIVDTDPYKQCGFISNQLHTFFRFIYNFPCNYGLNWGQLF